MVPFTKRRLGGARERCHEFQPHVSSKEMMLVTIGKQAGKGVREGRRREEVGFVNRMAREGPTKKVALKHLRLERGVSLNETLHEFLTPSGSPPLTFPVCQSLGPDCFGLQSSLRVLHWLWSPQVRNSVSSFLVSRNNNRSCHLLSTRITLGPPLGMWHTYWVT